MKMKINYSDLVKNWKYDQTIDESKAIKIIQSRQRILNQIHYWAFDQIMSFTAKVERFKNMIPALDEQIVTTQLGVIKVLMLSFNRDIFYSSEFKDDLELTKEINLFFAAYEAKQQSIFNEEHEV
jgi:hypothetical protein